jgi:hypothetical protein
VLPADDVRRPPPPRTSKDADHQLSPTNPPLLQHTASRNFWDAI